MQGRDDGLGQVGSSGWAVLESIGEGVCVLDADGRTVFANQAAEELTGYKAEDLAGEINHELLQHSRSDGTSYSLENCPLCGAFCEGTAYHTSDAVFWDVNGEKLHVGYTSDPVLEDGELAGAILIFRDVSARRRASEDMRRRFKNLLEESGEALTLTEGGEIFEANESFLQTFGYHYKEIIRMKFVEFVVPEERWKVGREIGTTGIETYEAQCLRKDSTTFPAQIQPRRFPYKDREVRMVSVLDITERKLAEDELRKQERRFRRLVEQAADALFVHDLRGDIVDVNQQACESLGYTREELLTMTVADIEQNIVPGGFEALWEEVLSSGPVNIEGCHRRKDGSTFPAEIRIGLFETEEGQLMLAAARDITGRKEAEEELRRSERSLVEAQRIASFGNWEYDLRADEARWSEELFRIFGHEPQAFVPKYKTFFEAVHREDRRAVRDKTRKALLSDSDSDIEFRIVRPDSEVRTVHARYEVLRSVSGRLHKLVGTVHDITERKQAEEALRRSEELFRALVQYGSDIITILDADGVIRYESPSIERVLGRKPEEVVGKNAFAIIHPEDAEKVSEVFFESLGGGLETASVEFRSRHADGSWRYLEGIGRNMMDDPAIGGIVINFRDVTDRKEYEEELRRSNAELEQFAYVASHDLQEPLRMVSSYTQLLGRRYRNQLGEDAEEFIGYAVDGAERMQRLINDLLAYSRVGTQGREFEPTDLSEIMENVLANLRLTIEETGAEVTSDSLPTVKGDRTQLTQLLQNLIGNAIKFRGEEPPEVYVGAERKGEEWRISVRDNGIGIDPEYEDKVFVIFRRLHGRGSYEGTGIGLAVCKRIVERHGGRIWVESAPGEGSTFYFTLPRAKEADR